MKSGSSKQLRFGRLFCRTVFFLSGGIITACSSRGIRVEEFAVRVDSLAVPVSVAAQDTLSIRLIGFLGSDQCSRLARVQRERRAGWIELRVIGERESGVDCSALPAPLNHVELVLPPIEGPFTVRVIQPDGTSLVRVVQVL